VAILGTRIDDFDLEREVLGDVKLSVGAGRDRDEILDAALGADLILAGAAPRFDAETLDRLGCRAIVRMGVGVDSIDLESSRRNGETVAVAPMVEMAGALT
jgi:phosphoglycerate dehydrogenase-like enzyme